MEKRILIPTCESKLLDFSQWYCILYKLRILLNICVMIMTCEKIINKIDLCGNYVLEKYISIVLRNCNWIIIQKKVSLYMTQYMRNTKINYSSFII